MLEISGSRARAELTAPAGRSGARQKQVRLSVCQQSELFERYEAGAFKKELARIYGVHVEPVRAIIRRQMQAN